MASPRILISGSGIAGSIFSYWLLRAYPSARITIVERSPSLRLTGAAVDLRSNAVDIVKWMNVEHLIREAGTGEQGIQLVGKDGNAIATLGATGNSEMQSITSEYEILRGTLNDILLKPVREKVNLVFNESVEKYENQEDGSVLVTFAKDKQPEKYDLLVAADGLGSRLRGQLLGAPPKDQIHDEGVHVGYFTIKKDLLEGSQIAKGLSAPGGRVIYLRPDPHPEGRTSCLIMTVTWPSDSEMKNRLNTAIREGNDAYKKLMHELFQGAGWLTPTILDCMDEADDFYCSIFGQVRAPRLHDGKVVLLGDAGHATPGLGTSLAIIGSYVLAGELLSCEDRTTPHGTAVIDYAKALKNYEEIMLPFVKKQQGNFPAMQLLNPQSTWGLLIRDTLLRIVTGLRIDKVGMYLASKLGGEDSKLVLRRYPWPAEGFVESPRRRVSL